MLINIWSTPRTGSVHHSYVLRDAFNAQLINEFFNRYHMSIYFTNYNGVKLNHREYVPGSFYSEYFVDSGKLSYRKIYGERRRTIDKEENYRLKLFDLIDINSQNLVMHNHVAPINKEVYNRLIGMTSKNVYVYRKDKRAQLASYAVAFSSKQFVLFKSEYKHKSMVSDIDKIHLENLINRIKIYDGLEKSDEIAYEDMEFKPSPNYPIKQVNNYKELLSDNMINRVNDLVVKYEAEGINEN